MPAISPIPQAISRPSTLVYERLRSLARKHLAHERCDHTFQPTALVHEAFLRLSARDQWTCSHSGALLLAASGIMRAILVDHARRKRSQKRGGDLYRVALTDEPRPSGLSNVDILALDEAMERLRLLDAELAAVVELRYFGGLTDPEIAIVRNCSTRTVRRAWKVARAWLARDLCP